MAFDPLAVANYFISLAEADGKELTPMKLQKLVYFAHGWWLALSDRLLLNEQVEAWKYGPVIPSLYREFSHYGDYPITSPAYYLIAKGPSASFEDMELDQIFPSIDDCPDEVQEVKPFLDRIWKVYTNYSAIQLSNGTHKAGSPWDQVY